MRFIRSSLAGLSALVMSAYLGALGGAAVVLCAADHAHSGATGGAMCHMPVETGAACPMHGATGSHEDHHGGAAAASDLSAWIACNCGATLTLEGLLGGPGLVTEPAPVSIRLPAAGAAIPVEPTLVDLPAQVSSPPPRA